ncbi:MAG: ketosteroid isomerase-like protein [Gammaproteobacteria bacterium]|jgi:ketosteroid isomerase-like protein
MQAMFTTALECETAFYAAFNECDLNLMMRVWATDTTAFCVHPGAAALHGRDSVMSSWRQIFAGAAGLNISISDPQVMEGEALAVRFVHENIRHGPGMASLSIVLATNVFVREGEQWRLCSHHASPSPAPASGSINTPRQRGPQGTMH